MGSALFSYVKTGEMNVTGDSNAEGIGIKRITENFKGAPIDDALQIDDRTMVEMVYWLLREEGIYVEGQRRSTSSARRATRRRCPTAARS